VAARLTLAVAVGVVAAAVGCAPPSSGQQGGEPPVPRITPQASLSAEMEATADLLTEALAVEGIRLDVAPVPTQPGEPGSLASAPRALRQADVHDPGAGYVLIYQLPDATTAAARGAEFADYLEGGPGQVNFPLDTQFSLAQVGSTLVFTWWSREGSADPDRAERAFEAIATVGASIPVVK
jgi:hypothetical protein